MKTFTNCAEKKAKQFLNLLQGYTKGIRMTAILILLLMGVSNAWADAYWPYAGFYEVYMTYSYNGKNSNYTFRDSDNGATDVTLGTLTTDINVTALYMKYYKNTGDWDQYGNVCGALMIYNLGNGDVEHQPNWSWDGNGDWHNEFQAHLYELSNKETKTLVDYNSSASGKYTLSLAFKMWGSDDNKSECGDNWWISNNSQNYKFKYTILPPAVSSIGISASGHLAGSGTQADPYVLVYGESLKLTASVNNSDANSNTHFTFGSNTASTAKTHTISNITNATAQKITIKAQNINKSDKSLKGTTLSKDIYYKYTPVYVYINGQSHQINNTTKQVTVALNRNANDETYTFKVHDDNNHWLGNSGTMERGGTSVHSGGWTMSVDDNNDCKLKADLTGDYTFTFIPAGNKVTVTYPQKSYFVAGSWDDWAGTAPSFVDASTPVSIYLEADQTYSFKVADLTANAKWYGNDGTMTRANSTAWERSTNEGNCQITTDFAGNYDFTFDQSNKKLTVTYPTKVTLGYCDFGQYGIEYDGTTYYSKPDENVEINIPLGASVRVLEGTPLNNAYTGNVIKAEPTKEELITGQTLTINGDITLDDNFKTKEPHVVYLGVPETLDNWQLENNQTYYIWRYDSKGAISMTAADEGSYVFTKDGIKYYRFTIAAGCNSYRFERKNKDSFTGTTYACSEWLDFQIPLTDVNCFTLKDEKDDKNRYKGTWGVLPAQVGDYRLLYVEQVVEKDANGNTIITRKKAHPSDIIRKGTDSKIVSLHTYKERTYTANAGGGLTYTSSNNPEIILQRCTAFVAGKSQWEDVECQMVYGPLETLPIMANLPGRKNASPNSNIDDLQYQDGIEIIKQDVLNHPDKGNGVWNFVVTQDNAGNASVQWDQTHRYTGEYYIRTDNAEGGWDQYTLNDNYMTYSQYAKDHSGFSHYFCRWVEKNITPNTKFVIANDHGVAISDTLSGDQFTDIHGNIQEDANIRWSWNMVNNEIARAYIQGTWKAGSQERNRNLVVNYKPSSEGAVEDLLDDSGDWIYQKDFPVKVGSHLNSLTAQYPVSTGSTQTFASNLDMLTGDPAVNDKDYKVRILYDFKINKTLVALVPNANEASIAIDVVIERINQGEATQVQAPIAYSNNQRSGEGSTVYGVMSFDKSHLTDPILSSQQKLTYWISFPFDVKLSEIFGFGEVGDYWMIKYYDGKDRAAKGLYDDNTFWKFITNRNYTLKANQGYVLALNKKVMDANSPIFTNTTRISLYFPSKEKLLNINTDYTQTTCTIPEYTCTITSPTDRRTKDSNWNFIGVPSFANKNRNTTNENLKYFYDYDYLTDTYSVAINRNSRENTFKSMFAYMVQFAGTIDWSTLASNGSQGLAAKKTDNVEKHVLRIELQQNNTKVDQTYIQLEDEEVTAMFDMNYDLTKLFNSKTNIYSLIPSDTDPIQVAANVMPIEETIIPLGIKLDAAGEYTFAMPEGTDGIVVELIDYENNTRTNMLLDEYTVNLGKGTFENRFALHVKPNKTTTSLEDVNTNTTGVKKYLIDGILYMQKDGALYDAQGKLVR